MVKVLRCAGSFGPGSPAPGESPRLSAGLHQRSQLLAGPNGTRLAAVTHQLTPRRLGLCIGRERRARPAVIRTVGVTDAVAGMAGAKLLVLEPVHRVL